MRIELLKYFYTVCEAGSINMAAQQLYISQQGLNSAIRRLEKEMDAMLFLRSNAGIQLTEEGVILQKHCEKILSAYTHLEIELNRKRIMANNESKTLKIVTNPLYSTLLARFFQDFFESTAQIQCTITEKSNEKIPEMLKKSHLDVGIMSYNNYLNHGEQDIHSLITANELKWQLLYEEELVYFMGKQNDLAYKAKLTNEDTQYSQIILSDNTSSAYTDHAKNISVILNSTDYSLQQYYMTSRNCISVLPKSVGQQVFDETKITYRQSTPPMINKIILVTEQVPAQYTVEENLFFNTLKLYFHSLNGK